MQLGDPGNGKSVLAATVVEELHGAPDSHCYYFFFSEIEGIDKRDSAYRAILAQALQSHKDDRDFIDAFDFAASNSDKGQMTASIQELLDLFQMSLEVAPNTYIVFDGVDECIEEDDLISEMIALFGQSQAKVLFFSRPNVRSLTDALPPQRRIKIGKRTESDIRTYVAFHLKIMKNRRLLCKDADLQELENMLVSGSDGMFLWAKLMMEYLKLPVWQPKKRAKLIRKVTKPERLDDMYGRIMSHIRLLDKGEQRLAEWTFAWLMYARRELTAEELRESSKLVYIETEEDANEEVVFEESVIMSCACLVKKDTTHSTPLFRFMHVSAKEYLINKCTEDTNSSAFLSKANMHATIARGSIQYLLDCISPQPLSGISGEDITESRLIERYPLSKYAVLNWIYHLRQLMSGDGYSGRSNGLQGKKCTELVSTLSRFLSAPKNITTWVEAHHVFRTTIDFDGLKEWSHFAAKRFEDSLKLSYSETQSKASRLADHLQNLTRIWGSRLMETPSCVWMEVAAFNPSQFIADNGLMRVHKFCPSTEELSNVSTVPLTTTSAISLNGTYIGVLTIWPSR